MIKIDIREPALIVLIGISGSGKSAFARRHFTPSRVLSADMFRSGDRPADGREGLLRAAADRLGEGRLTVIDAANVLAYGRSKLIRLARAHHAMPVAVVLAIAESVCWERVRSRGDRELDRNVLRRQQRELRRSLGRLKREGFSEVHVLPDTADVEVRCRRDALPSLSMTIAARPILVPSRVRHGAAVSAT